MLNRSFPQLKVIWAFHKVVLAISPNMAGTRRRGVWMFMQEGHPMWNSGWQMVAATWEAWQLRLLFCFWGFYCASADSLLNLGASILLLFLVLAHGSHLKIPCIDLPPPGSNKITKIRKNSYTPRLPFRLEVAWIIMWPTTNTNK
jgi:hypothetical protein